MDLQLDEEQQLLKNSARAFLEKECPPSLVRAMEEDERGFPADFWQKMANLGWLGLPFQEKYGGAGGSLITLAVLLEELGRACDPTPFFSSVVAAGLTIQDGATEAQKQEILPAIAGGKLILTVALLEESALYSHEGINLPARKTADGFVVSGCKLFVENAHMADYMLTAVRTGDNPGSSRGISLLLIDPKSSGVSLTPLSTVALDKQFQVELDNVVVPTDRLVGPPDEAWPLLDRAISRAAILQCAAQVGAARRVLEMTVEYVQMRVQFGRSIGSFQAVQHSCAEMWMDTEAAWLATYEAIWRLSEGLPARSHIALAKAWTGDAHTRTCLTAHQLHGGIGFMQEYDLQLWTRRAKAMEMKWGTPAFYRKELARAL